MNITSITVSNKVTVQHASYQPIDYHVSVTAELSPDDDADEVVSQLFTMLGQRLAEEIPLRLQSHNLSHALGFMSARDYDQQPAATETTDGEGKVVKS